MAAWPSVEKCRLCDAKFDCTFTEREVQANPEEVLKRLVVLKAQSAQCEEILRAEVARTGKPVETPDGDCYGRFGAKKPTLSWDVRKVQQTGGET